jgi:nucleoid DNA-binding protein
MPTRVNRETLAAILVYRGYFPTKTAAIDAIKAIFDTIGEEVTAGNRVSIPAFGSFTKFKRKNGKHKVKFVTYKKLHSAVV